MQNTQTLLSAVAAVALVGLGAATSQAASDSWIAGTDGAYSNSANWTGGNVPNDAADVATVEGAGSIVAFGAADDVTLADLDLAISTSGGAPVFNQSGGTLSVDRLRFGGGGGSRNPTYNLTGGTLNIATTFSWGNGSNANFNYSAGTVNHSGTGFLSMGIAGGARAYINGSGTGVFNADELTALRLGTTGNGRGTITLADSAVFNINGDGNTYLGNNGGSGFITMSGDSELNAPNHILSVGQFGAGTGSITMSGGTMRWERIAIGGDNAESAVTGTIDMTGGTIETGQIRRGSSTVPSDATANYLKVSGGTIRATAHANNNDFFANNLYVEIGPDGLIFDTNGNDVGFANAIAGVGSITKVGAGTLSFTGASTYTGATIVGAGAVRLGAGATLAETAPIVLGGGILIADGETNTLGSLGITAPSTLQFGGVDDVAHALTINGVGDTSGSLSITNWDAGVDEFLFATEADALSVAALSTFIDPSGVIGEVEALVIPSGGSFAIVPVPEPTSLAALALGTIGLLARRRA